MAERQLIWALLLLGLAVRVAVIGVAERHPLIANPVVDSREYHRWAAEIAAGDLLGDRVFYQAPLYPYVLAAVYAVGGPRVRHAYLLNALLEVLALWLLHRATRRLLGREPALLTLLLGAGYGVFLFNVVQVEKSSLDLLLVSALLLALLRAEDRPDRAAAWTIAGVVLGLAALNRGNLLLIAPLLLARIAAGRGPGSLRRMLWFGLGLCLPILPVTARNAIVGNDLVLTSAHGGFNFYLGNHERADGASKRVPLVRENPEFEPEDARAVASRAVGRPLRFSEASDWWTRRAIDWIRSQPGKALLLYVKKVRLLLAAYEIADSVDSGFVFRQSGLLGLPRITYGLVLPLGLAGLLVARRRHRPLGPLPFLLGSVFVSLLPFYVFSRYRLPLVPLLLPLAGYALVEAARRARRRSPSIGWGLLVLPAIALVQIPPGWIDRSSAVSEANLGNLLSEQGRWEEAIAAYDRALAQRPGYQNARLGRAGALRRSGRLDRAERELETIVVADPDDWQARYELGRLLLERGRTEAAARHFEAAVRVWPLDPDLHFALGVARRRAGRLREAIESYREVLERRPDDDEARWNLALLLADTGAPELAREQLLRLEARRPDDPRLQEALRLVEPTPR